MGVFIEELIPEEDLAHYGKPKRSGRYPWGSGENPYHHGRSNPFGRLKAKKNEKKLAKKRKQEKARKAMEKPVETAEQREERKRQALKTGTATDIAPFLKEMSTQEIRQARERLEEQEKFMKLVVKETPEAQRAEKMDRYMRKIEKATNYANTGIDAYNVIARTHNAFSKKQWAVIPTGKDNKDNKGNNSKGNNDTVAKLTRTERKNAKKDAEIDKLKKAISTYKKDDEIKRLEENLKEYRKAKKKKYTNGPQEP